MDHLDEDKWIGKNNFVPSVAWTAHAVQGDKIDGDFMVFEAEDNPDWRWFYTAVSRATSLRKAWVYIGEPLFDVRKLNDVIAEKIEGYKAQDRTAGRDFVESDYITVKWVKDALISQKYRCAERDCQARVETQWNENTRDKQFIVDRRNNDLPHTRDNCRITCVSCNARCAVEGKK